MNSMLFNNNKNNRSNIFNEKRSFTKYFAPYKNKTTYDIKIPANIFQTWHTKFLPYKMYKSVQRIKNANPGFKYYLYDDNDCREFIKNHFDADVLNAYDRLIPGAYKADLWRYCILYKLGGIYLDIKYIPVNDFKFINLLEEEHWTLDNNKIGIYNALMVCKPNNEILLKAINQIVVNVKTKFYGNGFLEPTGPRLLANYFKDDEKRKFDTKHIVMGQHDYDKYILFNGCTILRCYPGYLNEREKYSKKKHYSVLWRERKIYL